MKKLSLLFLVSLIVFVAFIVYSLAKSKPTTPPAKTIQETITPQTTSVPTTNPSVCIITVNGKKYDVTGFRSIHKGGDVFKCDTDMSKAFSKKHPVEILNKVKDFLLP